MKRFACVLLASALISFGCGDTSNDSDHNDSDHDAGTTNNGQTNDDPETFEAANRGQICIGGMGDSVFESNPDIVADTELPIRILMVPCEGCVEDVVTECNAMVDEPNSTITIESSATWKRGSGDECLLDVCREIEATCELSGLSEGTYSVTHGEDEFEFVVPSMPDCPLDPQ